ncbi:MAG: class I SAM-dependent methyltransferase [Candidatus Didemnitutus sp.]|nr:class I SAM-dependent methyltransferase [Candidatus Didemnitutus sp.]
MSFPPSAAKSPPSCTAADPARVQRPLCPICGGSPAGPLPAPAPWALAWCDPCQFGFLTNPPDYAAMTGEFEWESSSATENQRRRAELGTAGAKLAALLAGFRQAYRRLVKRDKLNRVIRDSALTGDLIDLGCGTGNLWDSFPADCAPVGIELSPVSARKCRARLATRSGRFIEADALNGLRQLPDASAQGAIAISFLEHDVRPVETLRELHRVLRDGGAFVIKVPNYACWNRTVRGLRWCGFRFPDHVNYFTPRALREICARTGFRVARFGWFDQAPTSDNMWCVARKVPTPAA